MWGFQSRLRGREAHCLSTHSDESGSSWERRSVVIIVRNVFQAHLGKAHGLVEDFKSFFEHAPMEGPMENRRLRLLTDLSGPFDTVVMEIEHESLAAAEALRPQLSSRARSSRTPLPAPSTFSSPATVSTSQWRPNSADEAGRAGAVWEATAQEASLRRSCLAEGGDKWGSSVYSEL